MEIKIGQRFEFEPQPNVKMGSDGFAGYSFEKKIAVEFVKNTERFLLQSIIQRAQENGITDLYVLNEDFVISAILEKRERETPDYWVPFIPPLSAGDACTDARDAVRHPTEAQHHTARNAGRDWR